MRKTIIVCDRCGKQIKASNIIQVYEPNLFLTSEMCDECASEIHELLLKNGFNMDRPHKP